MSTSKNTNLVAIITMCFIFAMISFVTNMGAPFGNIWGSNTILRLHGVTS